MRKKTTILWLCLIIVFFHTMSCLTELSIQKYHIGFDNNINIIDEKMISRQLTLKPCLDIATPATKARGSNVYSPETAWDLGYTGKGINIAVLDSGVDDTHESLEGKFVAGVEFRGGVGVEGNPVDVLGHGTSIAGAAMGTGGQSGKYKGVAPDAKLIDVKIGGNAPVHYSENTNEGIEWCIEHKDEYDIRIISLSFGGDYSSDGSDDRSQLVNEAAEAGIVVVVAGGNEGPNNDGFGPPASADDAIVVGAIYDKETIDREDDEICTFSNRGPREDDGDNDPYDELKPDVVAPGEDVVSAAPGNSANDIESNDGYSSHTGTSIATPFVSGVVALMLEANPNLKPKDVKYILQVTAESRGEPSYPDLSLKYNTAYGFGIVDAYEAVKMALTGIPPQADGNGYYYYFEPVELFPPININYNSVELSWSEYPIIDFTKYEIHISQYSNFTPIVESCIATIENRTTTFHLVTDLNSETTYYFKVVVYNSYNQFRISNEIQVTTLAFMQEPINGSSSNYSNFLENIPIIAVPLVFIIMIIFIAIFIVRKRRSNIIDGLKSLE